MLRRLGILVARRPGWTVAAWVILAIMGAVLASGLSKQLANRGFDVPGSSSYRANQLTQAHFPRARGSSLFIAATSASAGPGSLASALARARQTLTHSPEVAAIGTAEISPDGRAAVLPFQMGLSLAGTQAVVPTLAVQIAAGKPHGVDVQVLGQAAIYKRYSDIAAQDLKRSESLSFPAPLLMLLVAFLSVIAALVPIVSGAICLIVIFGSIYVVALVTSMSVFVENVASVLGIGLSIDFALFSVTRFRELSAELPTTDPKLAAARTVATTGRAIALSAATITASLALILIVKVGVFSSIALGAMLATVFAAAAGLTLVPALLAMLGPRLDRLRLQRGARRFVDGNAWRRLAAWTARRPVLAVVLSGAVLVVLALPLSSVSIVSRPTTELPPGDALRNSTRAIERSFGAAAIAPVVVVAPSGSAPQVTGMLRSDPGIRRVISSESGSGGWQRITAELSSDPDASSAYATVKRLRSAFGQHGLRAFLGGQTAELIDLVDRIDERAPYVVIGVLLLGALVLTIGLRAPIVAIKASLTTALSAAAGLGVINFIFTDLGGRPGLGYFVPLLLFAIVFGLSVDYESFLMSRIKEEVDSGRSNRYAVIEGLARTGRPITLAGAVMVTVFLVFAAAQLSPFQELGLGLAVAVMLDVTVVRLLLVPGALVLLGKWNWWTPRYLQRTGQRQATPVPQREEVS